MADNYVEFNVWKDSAVDYEMDARWQLAVWADDGKLWASVGRSRQECYESLIMIGELEGGSVEQLYSELFRALAEWAGEPVADALVPDIYGGLMSWMFELVYPRDRHWLVAAVVGRAIQKANVVRLEDAHKAVYWGLAERQALCEQAGVSVAEFDGAHKVAVTFLDTFEEYFRIKTQDDPEVEVIDWIKNWSRLS